RFAFLERNIAACPFANSQERSRLTKFIAGIDDQQFARGNGRRHANRRHSTKFPQQVAIEIIGSNLAGGASDNLRAQFVLPNERRGPAGLLVAPSAPNFPASSLIECDDERFLLVVVYQIDALAVNNRRRAGPPAEPRGISRPFFRPEQLAVEIVAK